MRRGDRRSESEPESAYAGAAPFRRARKPPLIARAAPISSELPGYDLPRARSDLLAGLTVAALALPSAMAFAELAGLSPVNGLYALLLPAVAYWLIGSSRQLIVGPEGTVSTLVAASVLPLAAAGSAEAAELAAMLALLVAACFLAARALRLGWVADYFSRPVLVGYIHGVAVVLVISQLGKLLGLSIQARDPLGQLSEVVQEIGAVNATTLAVAAVALAGMLVMRSRAPKLPGALIMVVAAIAVSWALDLDSHGVAVVGPIPSGLPSLTLPSPPLGDVLDLVPAALGVFVVSFADEILTARAFAGRRGQSVRASQELFAMGAANAAAGVSQGFSIGASGSRTAVNDAMGARTQFAGLFAAGTTVLILLFLTGPVQYLPTAVLGAVIVVAAIGLIEPAAWRALAAIDPVELAIAAVTTSCVVLLGVLEALVIAVGLSIIDTVRRSARPHDAVLGWSRRLGRYADVSLNPGAKVLPGVVLYRLDDRLFFANARYVKGRVHEALRAAPTETAWLVFDAEAVTYVDSTGLQALDELIDELRADGITLVMARVRTAVQRELDDAALTEKIGTDHFHPTVRAAVQAITADRVP